MTRCLALLMFVVAPVFASLPRAIDCGSQTEAQNLTLAYVAALGAEVCAKRGESLSMAPLVRASAIFLYVRDWPRIERGCVAIRRDADENVCHDVIARVGDEWEMKGRANPSPDRARLTAANYVGTVVMVLNYPSP